MTTVTRMGVQCRSEIKGNKLGGYASVFDQTTDLGIFGQERIARTAFKRALDDPRTDVRALWNHDSNFPLGRQSAGTLRLSVDSSGLEYEVSLPNTSYANDIRELVERGDVTGASFGFIPDEWHWEGEGEARARVHTSVGALIDVSPVTFPAYDGASTGLRSVVNGATRRRSQLIRARFRALGLPEGA